MRTPAWVQRATTWTAIAGYALVASGLPLPVGVAPPSDQAIATARQAAKDRSRPFPCMDKPCGCATAEQCFANCCCHTPAERLAWARAHGHGVEPAIIAALERRVAAAAKPTPEGSCCAAARKPTCCSEQAEDAAATPAEVPVRHEIPRTRGIVLKAMLACGGIVAQWCAAAAALPPPVVACPLTFPCIERLTLGDDTAACVASSPAAPPPRMA